MKKIMVLAAVALMAVASQAAAYKWSASGVKGADGETAYSGNAVIHCFLASDLTTEIASYETTMANGSISSFVIGDKDENFTAGSMYKFYYTMVDSDGNLFDSRGWTEAGEPGTTYKQAKAQQNTQVALSFGTAGSWKAGDVPEPTSGLLLLIGMAGLALKRKHV